MSPNHLQGASADPILPWTLPTQDFQERLQKWAEDHPQDQYGRHVYSAEDFGMTDEELNAKFVEYRHRFQNRPPGEVAPVPRW